MGWMVSGALAAVSVAALALASPAKGDPRPDLFQWISDNGTVLCQSLDHFGDSMSTFDQERNWIERQGFDEVEAHYAMTAIITTKCDDHFAAYDAWDKIRNPTAAG